MNGNFSLPSHLRAEDRGHGRGRGLYCVRDIAAGEEFLSASPFAAVPVDFWLRNVCSNCMKFSDRARLRLMCSACKLAFYCSSECQEAAANGIHEGECIFLRKLAVELKKIPREFNFPPFRTRLRFSTQLFSRVAILQLAQTPDPQAPAALSRAATRVNLSPTTADLFRLATNREKYDQLDGLVDMFRETYKILLRVFPRRVIGEEEAYVDVLCREECNSFGFWDPGDEMYAYGLYPVASFFNHDCAPNVCKFTRGRDVVFRAIRKIPEGEEIVISYVLPNDGTFMRQKALKETYLFDCLCVRCKLKPGDPDIFLQTYVHQCGGFLYPNIDDPLKTQCSKCGALASTMSKSGSSLVSTVSSSTLMLA